MEGAKGLFAVDRWTCRKNKAFFLTHMHADHTKGLSERWQHGPLYCSRITAALLLLKFPAFDRSLIHVLPLGTPSLIPLPEHQLLEVTPIDADHCPGSVMFVFRGSFGCILHTGDFRWELGSPKLDAMKRCIAAAVGGSRVDLLCLDNTFCNACFSFPPRHVAAQKVVDIIASHGAYDVLVGIDMLGKEELLISIAKALKTKIWIWPERLQTMRLLGISDFFITDTTATRIRAVPRYSISHETLRMLNEIKPTIAVLPSGLWCLCKAFTSDSCLDGTLGTSKSDSCFGNKHAKAKAEYGFLKSSKTHINGVKIGGENEDYQVKPAMGQDIFFVSYSLHSCFSELKEFVEFVKPTSMKGNLSSSHVNINPCQTLHQTCCIGEENSKQFSRFDEKGPTRSMLKHDGSMQCCDIVNEDGIHSKDTGIHMSVLEHDVTLHCCHIVNENGTHISKDNCFCRKVKGRKRLRKASYMRAWAMLRKRRGGGAFVWSET